MTKPTNLEKEVSEPYSKYDKTYANISENVKMFLVYDMRILMQGELPDGTIIAVKQLSSKSHQGNREFVNEIGMISGLNHPNLVKLYGCCVEKNQLLLVYEYMQNNSLALVLHGT